VRDRMARTFHTKQSHDYTLRDLGIHETAVRDA
jgi:hypothetical protein